MRHRLFKKGSYDFVQSDFKQIIISHDSIVDSSSRIVIFDGPGSRSPRLLTIPFNHSIERKTMSAWTRYVIALAYNATNGYHTVRRQL